jgi:hypothetical protein
VRFSPLLLPTLVHPSHLVHAALHRERERRHSRVRVLERRGGGEDCGVRVLGDGAKFVARGV